MLKHSTRTHRTIGSHFKMTLTSTRANPTAEKSSSGSSTLNGRVLSLTALFLLLIPLNSGCSSSRIVGPSLSASSVQTLSSSAETLKEVRQVGRSFTASSNAHLLTKQSIFKRSVVLDQLFSRQPASSSPQQ